MRRIDAHEDYRIASDTGRDGAPIGSAGKIGPEGRDVALFTPSVWTLPVAEDGTLLQGLLHERSCTTEPPIRGPDLCRRDRARRRGGGRRVGHYHADAGADDAHPRNAGSVRSDRVGDQA